MNEKEILNNYYNELKNRAIRLYEDINKASDMLFMCEVHSDGFGLFESESVDCSNLQEHVDELMRSISDISEFISCDILDISQGSAGAVSAFLYNPTCRRKDLLDEYFLKLSEIAERNKEFNKWLEDNAETYSAEIDAEIWDVLFTLNLLIEVSGMGKGIKVTTLGKFPHVVKLAARGLRETAVKMERFTEKVKVL